MVYTDFKTNRIQLYHARVCQSDRYYLIKHTRILHVFDEDGAIVQTGLVSSYVKGSLELVNYLDFPEQQRVSLFFHQFNRVPLSSCPSGVQLSVGYELRRVTRYRFGHRLLIVPGTPSNSVGFTLKPFRYVTNS